MRRKGCLQKSMDAQQEQGQQSKEAILASSTTNSMVIDLESVKGSTILNTQTQQTSVDALTDEIVPKMM